MPFIPVADTIECVLTYDQDGVDARNVLNMEPVAGAGPFNLATVSGVAERVVAAWSTHVMPHLSVNIEFTHVEARDLTVQAGVQAVWNASEPGGSAGGALPPGSAAVVSWRTQLAGRSFQGRSFLPGLDENDVENDGSIETATHVALNAGLVAFFEALDDAAVGTEVPCRLVVVSRYSGVDVNGEPIPRAAGVTTPVSGLVLRQYIKSQRRRNERG